MSEQPRQQKLLRDELERLVMLLTECSTQLEDAAYERELQRLTREAIDDGDDTEIEAALAALKSAQPSAYDQLLTFAEESAQSIVTDEGASMLFIVPLLAWSRYRNFCGEIAASAASRVAQSFKRLMTSGKDDVVVRIGNVLIAPEHIPETLTETRTVLARLIASHEDQEGDVVDLRDLIDKPAAADFADSRYLLVAVSAKTPADIFRPATESYIDRARAMMNFCLEAHASLEFAMIGTVFEVQPPGAFFAAWRETESAMRVWSLKSLVDFIGSMGYEPQESSPRPGSSCRPIRKTPTSCRNFASASARGATPSASSRAWPGPCRLRKWSPCANSLRACCTPRGFATSSSTSRTSRLSGARTAARPYTPTPRAWWCTLSSVTTRIRARLPRP